MFYDQFLTIKFRLAFSWLHLAATPSDCKVRTEEKNYINIYIWEGEQREQTHRQLLLDSWGLLGQESRQSLFDVSAKLFQVFLTAAVKCWKPAPVPPQTTYNMPRTVQKSKTSQSQSPTRSRSLSRSGSQAYRQGYGHGPKCPKVPPHVAYQRTSLYGAHTHTYWNVHVLMMAFLACSKQSSWNETKTKTKKNQKRKTIKPFYSFHARSPRNEKFYNLNWHLNW